MPSFCRLLSGTALIAFSCALVSVESQTFHAHSFADFQQTLSEVKMHLIFGAFRPLLIACSLLATLISLASAKTVSSTILVFARNAAEATSGTSGLKAYGIPYQLILVPSGGITLPTLNTATVGNYGGIIVMSEVAYEYSTGWASGITATQWQTLYNYQTSFGVRMARLDVYPGPDFGMYSNY